MKTKKVVYRESNNIFADIGVGHPERVLARARIMFHIAEIIRKRGLTQKGAAEILNIPQPKVSCLMNGKLSNFSMDRLFEFLNALDTDVKIIVEPKPKQEKIATTNVFVGSSL